MEFSLKKILIGIILTCNVIFVNAANADDITFEDPFASIKEEILKESSILTFETRRISAKYPCSTINVIGANYPGYRGPGQLVIYYPGFDETTGTNEFGEEAIVEDNVVVKLSGANSTIPKNGFVISGHGSAKKWIRNNIKIGTNVIVEGRNLIVYTTPESYVFMAKERINEAEDFVSNAKKSSQNSQDDKKALTYLKKAKHDLKKAERSKEDTKIQYAKSSIEFSNLTIKNALPYLEKEFKGVWLRPTEKSAVEIRKTLDRIRQTGIKEVFLETFFHGYTIYPSSVMKSYGITTQNPKFVGFDPLEIYISEAHKRGMRVHCWFESFYIGNQDPAYDFTSILSVYPKWANKNLANYSSTKFVRHPVEHNGLFLDPANFEVTYFLNQLLYEIATQYKPDGINLDYIRYPSSQNTNVRNYVQSNWGYTNFARDEFMALYEIDPIEIQPGSTMWKKWSEYRRSKISNYIQGVREIIPSDIMLSAVIFPDYEVSLETKQQDWAKWSEDNLVDVIMPLIMTSDNELFHTILKDVKSRTSGETGIVTGLFVGFLDAEPEDLLKQISVSRALKSRGVALFDWAHLPQKYQTALKTRVFTPKNSK